MLTVIYDNNSCRLGELAQQDKKTATVKLYPELDAIASENNNTQIKISHLIYKTDLTAAQKNEAVAVIPEIDLALLWEMTAENIVWNIYQLHDAYFAKATLGSPQQKIQTLALILAIFKNEVNFTFNNQHPDNTTEIIHFKRNNQEEVAQKIYQKEQREKQHNYINGLYEKLINSQQPDWDIDPINDLLHSPNKNSLEYKAFIKASKELKIKPMDFLFKLGYIKSIDDFLIKQFYSQYYKTGDKLDIPLVFSNIDSLEYNEKVAAFSIDDYSTTEIDDALSVQYLPDGQYLIGVHIATAALCEQSLQHAIHKYSSVYFPGDKLTMLPKEIVKEYSLDENKILPVVSIYFELSNDLEIVDYFTTLEKIKIHTNLRNEVLEPIFNVENKDSSAIPHIKELQLLHQLANKLSKERGKPTTNEFAVEYSITFDDAHKICIKQRQKNNALNKTVSELMILANCSWGRLLANSFIPAIYRVKQGNTSVHSSSSPNSHEGLNVDYYTWATSPLRRSIDLINQMQIIKLIQKEKPLKSEDLTFATILANFDDTYSQYINFQNRMETYWSLRYIEQEQLKKLTATFIYKYLVQVDGMPLKLNLYDHHIKPQEAGSKIELTVKSINFEEQLLEFEVEAQD